jgi:hypothetical protein
MLQSGDGAYPPGNDGPHGSLETPLRNTSHWLLTQLCAYELTGAKRFQRSAIRAADFMMREEWRPGGASFWHRMHPVKDRCNGLIGQAWTCLALAEATRVLGRPEYAGLGLQVLNAHRYDPRSNLWINLEIDGLDRGINVNLNQQVWFACAATACLRMSSSPGLSDRLGSFRKNLAPKVRTRPDGIFYHLLPDSRWQEIRREYRARRGGHLNRFEVGYHAFTLLGLCKLAEYEPAPGSSPWTRNLEPALQALESPEFLGALLEDPFAFAYNPTGFEIARILDRLGGAGPASPKAREWVQLQLDLHFDSDTALMRKNSADPATLAARFCEAADLVREGAWRDRRDHA